MLDYNEGEMKTFIIDSAIMNGFGCREEIELFKNLSLAMELSENTNEFNVIDVNFDNGVNLGITTRFPHCLPEDISLMFFNINPDFDVKINETSKYVYNCERHFEIKIKKR